FAESAAPLVPIARAAWAAISAARPSVVPVVALPVAARFRCLAPVAPGRSAAYRFDATDTTRWAYAERAPRTPAQRADWVLCAMDVEWLPVAEHRRWTLRSTDAACANRAEGSTGAPACGDHAERGKANRRTPSY